MGKVLGTMSFDSHGAKLKASDSDYKHLQEILKLHSTSKPLHSSIVLQSIQYRDLDLQALTGSYQRDRGQLSQQHVHPVVAALFLPKINLFDTHMLQANIAYIVKQRYTKQPILTILIYLI